jgi:hypothetical protein
VVARLVLDAMWRSRWMYFAAGVALLPFWYLSGEGQADAPPIDMMALSLISVSAVGPMFAFPTLGLRAIRHLAVNNRDLWRATWILATVVATGGLLASKLISALLVIAFGGNPTASTEATLLSAVYDFSWAGVMLPVLPSLVYTAHGADARGILATPFAEAGRLVGLVACFGLPILVSDALPTRVGEFTSVTTGMVIVCLAIAFGTLAWTPQRGLLAGDRSHAHRASRRLQRRRTDRLTGISRVAVPYLLAMVAVPLGASLALASYGVMTGSGPGWFLPHAPTVFAPADIGDRGLTYFVLPAAVVIMLPLWNPWARLLKVLPLSVRQINALFLLTPFAVWAALWLLGASAYVFAYGTPRTFRVEFAFGMAGLATLAHAVLLRFQGSTALIWIPGFLAVLLPQLVKVGLRDGTAAHVAFALVGPIALGAAAVVNHRTLTRSTSSSRAYLLPQPPFGIPKAPGVR